LNALHALLEHCIPVKNVRLEPRDPPFVTPLVKSLLMKRLHLRQHGRTTEAHELAVHINELIRDIRSRQLAVIGNYGMLLKQILILKKEIRFYRNIYLQMLML